MIDATHLENKPFVWGVNDCFSVVRDIYRENFGMEITNYARPNDWQSDVIDLMRIYPEREGFEMVTEWTLKDLRPGDVMCMAIGEKNANHFAVYLGENKFIHHVIGRLSTIETLKDFWRQSICYILRHPEVPDLRVEKPTATIEELLRERYQIQTGEEA